MENKKQMDDITQMALICVVVVLMGLVPILSMWIPQVYANSQLEITSVNF